jgi:hypothetical protein
MLFIAPLTTRLECVAYCAALERLRTGPSDHPSDAEIEACVKECVAETIQKHPDVLAYLDVAAASANVLKAIYGFRDACLLADEAKGNA